MRDALDLINHDTSGGLMSGADSCASLCRQSMVLMLMCSPLRTLAAATRWSQLLQTTSTAVTLDLVSMMCTRPLSPRKSIHLLWAHVKPSTASRYLCRKLQPLQKCACRNDASFKFGMSCQPCFVVLCGEGLSVESVCHTAMCSSPHVTEWEVLP